MKWEKIPTLIITHLAVIFFCYFIIIAVHEGFHKYQFQRDYGIEAKSICLLGASSLRDGDMSYGLGWFNPDFSTGQEVEIPISELREKYESEANTITIITGIILIFLYNSLFIWMPIQRAIQKLGNEIEILQKEQEEKCIQ